MRRALAISAVIVLAAALAACDPNAASPVVHACVSNRSGTARIVAADVQCRRGEYKTSWNRTGQPGADGAAGARVRGRRGRDG